MKKHLFQTLTAHVDGNTLLREPQREAYAAIADHFANSSDEREVGIVLPVGCGKSGLITITPFAVQSLRALVIAPGTRIASQLHDKDFNPANAEFFYTKCKILDASPYPETAEIRGKTSNRGDLEEADVIITNIQQLQGTENRWLTSLPADFFDLILVDEAHHNVADSWEQLRQQFPNAKIVNVSATPSRADGQMMEGRIIYSFPVARAIQDGYVKRLKAVVLNPASLKFVRLGGGGVEEEVSREEVQRLGESDADFRRSIVTSKETLATIVDCSIQQLQQLRETTGENRHKIIASALNYWHCIQVKEAYEARGLRAAYVHSREEEATDDVLRRLENNELDVIVQVRKLGEGFDHKYLSVAAICSIFSNLSPFIQFVGRIMRVVDRDNPTSLNNQGIVVFHAGANIARRWSDFKDFSEADQTYFDELLPTEEVLDFTATPTQVIEPHSLPLFMPPAMEVTTQSSVSIEEDDLVEMSPKQREAYDLLLKEVGAERLLKHIEAVRIQPRKQEERRAARKALDDEIRNAVGRIIAAKNLKPKGRNYAKKSVGKDNFTYIKSLLDRRATTLIGRTLGEREEWSAEEIASIRTELPSLVDAVSAELE